MNGLSRSFGLMLALCLLVFVISLGIAILHEFSLEPAEESEGTALRPTGEKINLQETGEKQDEESDRFEWIGHSILSDGLISIQLRYYGPTIYPFNEKKVDFLINGELCTWSGKLVKGDGSQIVFVDYGEKIYILLDLRCSFKKGDILTFIYRPLNLEVSAQI